MLFVYYPKCSTCLKAKKWLDDNNIKYEERHIVEDNPKYDEISYAKDLAKKLKIEKKLLINLFSFYNFCTCVCNAYFFGINI